MSHSDKNQPSPDTPAQQAGGKNTATPRTWLWALGGCCCVCLYMAPYVVLQDSASIRAYDVLEPAIGIEVRVAREGNANCTLGGLPDAAVAGIPCVCPLVYKVLPPYAGYIVRDFVIRIIAFLGMFGFLRLLSQRGSLLLAWAVAVGFSWSPFYDSLGLAVAGQPLLALAAYRLTLPGSAAKRVLWLAVFFAAPFAWFVAMLPFVLVALLLWALVWRITARKTPWWLIAGIAIFLLGTAIANRSLIANSFLAQPIVWHRDTWSEKAWDWQRLPEVIREAGHFSVYSELDAEVITFPFIWDALLVLLILRSGRGDRSVASRRWVYVAMAVLAGLMVTKRSVYYFILHGAYIGAALLLRQVRPAQLRPQQSVAVAIFLGFIALCGMTYIGCEMGLLNWLPLHRQFRYARLFSLLPLVNCFFFFSALGYIAGPSRGRKLLVASLLLPHLALSVCRADWINDRHAPSFRDFVAAAPFAEAEQIVGRPKSDYRIVCVGFYPSSAHLNGFNTADGYWVMYPLKRLEEMRAAIAGEREKSAQLQEFDHTRANNFCYVWSTEIGETHDVRYLAAPPERIHDLAVDTAVLRQMGAEYVFSALPIDNAKEIGLAHLGTTQRSPGPHGLTLWVYQIVNR